MKFIYDLIFILLLLLLKCYDMYGNWDQIPFYRFTNIVDGFITSYVLAAMEGWPDIMVQYVN